VGVTISIFNHGLNLELRSCFVNEIACLVLQSDNKTPVIEIPTATIAIMMAVLGSIFRLFFLT